MVSDERLVRVVVLERPEGAGRVAARFRGVRHRVESFIASVYVGAVDPTDAASVASAPLAGTIAMYGHGDVYGGQDELDAALAPFDVDVDLTPALGEQDGPITISIVVRDLEDRLRPAAWLRFTDVTATPFP